MWRSPEPSASEALSLAFKCPLFVKLTLCDSAANAVDLAMFSRYLYSDLIYHCPGCWLQVWRDYRGKPESAVEAATVEPPAELLQGAESAGRGTAEQPEGEPHPVQQAQEARQCRQSRKILFITSAAVFSYGYIVKGQRLLSLLML